MATGSFRITSGLHVAQACSACTKSTHTLCVIVMFTHYIHMYEYIYMNIYVLYSNHNLDHNHHRRDTTAATTTTTTPADAAAAAAATTTATATATAPAAAAATATATATATAPAAATAAATATASAPAPAAATAAATATAAAAAAAAATATATTRNGTHSRNTGNTSNSNYMPSSPYAQQLLTISDVCSRDRTLGLLAWHFLLAPPWASLLRNKPV